MVVRKKAKKTPSSDLSEAALPKKGSTTFSEINGMGDKKSEMPIFFDKLIEALNSDRNVFVTIEDTRKDPNIILEPNITVENPNIHIDVKPTPIEVKVPTQRIPEPPAPKITVKNEIDLSPICWISAFIAFILLFDLVVKIWQLPM